MNQDLTIVHTTPVYQALKDENKGLSGGLKYWVGKIATDGQYWYTSTEFWMDTNDGQSKHQESAPTKIETKNSGRANERFGETQAKSELNSMVNTQIDKGYYEEGSSRLPKTTEFLLPMLAKKFAEHKHKIKWTNIFSQPKFDGNRQISNGEVMWSRQGKQAITECVKHLLFPTNGYIIDGELILPPEYSFQETVSAVKKYSTLSPKLLHRVYDVILPGVKFSERYEILKSLMPNAPTGVVLAETVPLASEEEAIKYHSDCVTNGWEGIMIRTDSEKGYEVNRRSDSLLKMKSFDDSEFLVIDVETGRGKFEGMGILLCQTEDGTRFSATPRGTEEFRRSLYENKEDVIGKKWLIRYFGYTTSVAPVPRFPIGICERDEVE